MSTKMLGADLPVGAGTMSGLRVRVSNVDRAADFFGALFGWKFQCERLAKHVQLRVVPARTAISAPVDAVFVDDPGEAPVRLEFEVDDVMSTLARVHRLGGTGDAAAAFDDQGVPLAFAGRRDHVASDHVYASQVGVVILDVPDTARACAFHAGLFQRTFHQIGSGGRWWVDHMALGIFPAAASAVRFWCVVGALEPAMIKVRQLGGEAVDCGSMGPYQVCDCRDDQGTAFGLWYDPQLKLAWPTS
jgi:predicted enzyme related to lactoylglutathione lyase